MSIDIEVLTRRDSGKTRLTISDHMDFCPVCNRGIEPIIYSAHFSKKSRYGRVQIIYQCPLNDCNNIFIGYFEHKVHDFISDGIFYLKHATPKNLIEEVFSSEINEISPSFGEIYNQAKFAEDFGLDEIPGGGYRKALEYLIKDYLIKIKQIEKDKIEKTYLGICISDFVDNDNLKACAKRAAWLGNDEIHFFRIWESRDIEDLKKLIKLSIYWIEGEVITQQYSKDMPEKAK